MSFVISYAVRRMVSGTSHVIHLLPIVVACIHDVPMQYRLSGVRMHCRTRVVIANKQSVSAHCARGPFSWNFHVSVIGLVRHWHCFVNQVCMRLPEHVI